MRLQLNTVLIVDVNLNQIDMKQYVLATLQLGSEPCNQCDLRDYCEGIGGEFNKSECQSDGQVEHLVRLCGSNDNTYSFNWVIKLVDI